MKNISLDKTDKRILSLLQHDADITLKDIATKVSLSSTPCWKRIQRLRKSGVIRKTVALLDPECVELDQTVFVAIKTNQHKLEWSEHFAEQMQKLPEVMEVYRMSGEIDYMLKVVVKNTRAYDQFYKRMIAEISLSDITSMFAMEEIKYITALPVDDSSA